jgi:hypothetical protein
MATVGGRARPAGSPVQSGDRSKSWAYIDYKGAVVDAGDDEVDEIGPDGGSQLRDPEQRQRDDSDDDPTELPGTQTRADVWWPEDSARLPTMATIAIRMTTTGNVTPDDLSSW